MMRKLNREESSKLFDNWINPYDGKSSIRPIVIMPNDLIRSVINHAVTEYSIITKTDSLGRVPKNKGFTLND